MNSIYNLFVQNRSLREAILNIKYLRAGNKTLASMTEKILPLAAMEKLLKKCGAARISEDAKDAMKETLELYGQKIGEQAVRLAEHAGRKTIKGSDVKVASRS